VKVKITMEADVTDLPAFNQPEAGRQNVFPLLEDGLHCQAIEHLMRQMILEKETEPAMHKALIDKFQQDRTLTERLIDSVNIQYGPRSPERGI